MDRGVPSLARGLTPNPCYGTSEGIARDPAHGSRLLPSAGMKGISPFS